MIRQVYLLVYYICIYIDKKPSFHLSVGIFWHAPTVGLCCLHLLIPDTVCLKWNACSCLLGIWSLFNKILYNSCRFPLCYFECHSGEDFCWNLIYLHSYKTTAQTQLIIYYISLLITINSWVLCWQHIQCEIALFCRTCLQWIRSTLWEH